MTAIGDALRNEANLAARSGQAARLEHLADLVEEVEAEFAEAQDAAHAEPEPYLVEWATEVDTLGTKEIWDSEAEARTMADRYGQRLFRVEWTEVPR